MAINTKPQQTENNNLKHEVQGALMKKQTWYEQFKRMEDSGVP